MAAGARVAYCTLLTSDAYLPGAMVLAHSLRDCGTKEQLAVLVTLDSLQESTITELKKVYDQIIPVDPIVNKAPANLYLMGRPDLISTFTKIQLWKQTQFEHLIYIDADVVALRAPDELFQNPPDFAAVPDIGWPDCFNSGVLSLKPNMGDYYALRALADRGISFDGADQGLLNMHFRDWERLSFTYNCTPSGNYQYVPAYRHFQSSINMVHYIGPDKPWIVGRNHRAATGVYNELLGRWWAVYDKHYRSEGSQIAEQVSRETKTVQQYVTGEMENATYGFSSVGYPAGDYDEPETIVHTTEPSLTDKIDPAEDLQEGELETGPRDYSMEWDAQHQPPPSHSRPEAANFPHEVYSMSADPTLFRAPQNPQPPKGMYYEVPTEPPTEKLPPIFPWERYQGKASRVFPDDIPPKSAPSLPTPSVTTDSNDEASSTSDPATPTDFSAPAFSHTNAWDEIPGINRYISNLPQNRRAKVQVLLNNQVQTPPGMRTPTGPDNLASPGLPSQDRRRPSIKLTDFPTEIERPSLPVTPAPVRRPSFWGAERDAAGGLPPAEGVPHQNEWDPAERLVELARRQSKVLEEGTVLAGGGSSRPIPDRDMPPSASKPEAIFEENEERRADDDSKEAPVPAAAAAAAATAAAAAGVETGQRIPSAVAPAIATTVGSEPDLGLPVVPVFGALNFAGGDGAAAAAEGDVEGRRDELEVEVAPDEGRNLR